MGPKRERGGGSGRGGSQRIAPRREETKQPSPNTASEANTTDGQEADQKEEKKEPKPASNIPPPKATREPDPSSRSLPKDAAQRSKLPVTKSYQAGAKDSEKNASQPKSRPGFKTETSGIFTNSIGKSTTTPEPSTLPPVVVGPLSRIPRVESSRNKQVSSIPTAKNFPKSSMPLKVAGITGSKGIGDASKVPAASRETSRFQALQDKRTSINRPEKPIASQPPLEVWVASHIQLDDHPPQPPSENASEAISTLTLSTSEGGLVEGQVPPLESSSRLSGRFPNTGVSPATGSRIASSPLRVERPTSSGGRPISRRDQDSPVSPADSDTLSERQPASRSRPPSRRRNHPGISPTGSDPFLEHQTSSGSRRASSRGKYSPVSRAKSDILPEFAGPDSQDPAEWLAYWDKIARQHTPTSADFPPSVTDVSEELIEAFLVRQRNRQLPARRSLRPSPAQTPTQESSDRARDEELSNIRRGITDSNYRLQYQPISPITERSSETGSRKVSLADSKEPENRKLSVASSAKSEVSQGSSSPFVGSPIVSPTKSDHSQASESSDSVASNAAQGTSTDEQRSPLSPESQHSQGSRSFDCRDSDSATGDESQLAAQAPTESAPHNLAAFFQETRASRAELNTTTSDIGSPSSLDVPELSSGDTKSTASERFERQQATRQTRGAYANAPIFRSVVQAGEISIPPDFDINPPLRPAVRSRTSAGRSSFPPPIFRTDIAQTQFPDDFSPSDAASASASTSTHKDVGANVTRRLSDSAWRQNIAGTASQYTREDVKPLNTQQSSSQTPIGAKGPSSPNDPEDLYDASPTRQSSTAPATGFALGPDVTFFGPPIIAPPSGIVPSAPVGRQASRFDENPEPHGDEHAGPPIAQTASPPPRVSLQSPARSSRTVITGTGTSEDPLKLESSNEEPDTKHLQTLVQDAASTLGRGGSDELSTFDDADDEFITPPTHPPGHPIAGTPAPSSSQEPARPRPSRAPTGSGFVQSDDEDFGYLGPLLPRTVATSASTSSDSQTAAQTGIASTNPSTRNSSTAAPSSSTPQRQSSSAIGSGRGDPGHPESSDDEDDEEKHRNLPADSPDPKPPRPPKRDSDSDSDDGSGQPSKAPAARGQGRNVVSAPAPIAAGGSQRSPGSSAPAPSTQGVEGGLYVAPGQDVLSHPEKTLSRPPRGEFGQSTDTPVHTPVHQKSGAAGATLQTIFPPTPSLTDSQGDILSQGRAVSEPQTPPQFSSAATKSQPGEAASSQLNPANPHTFRTSPMIPSGSGDIEIGKIPVTRAGGGPSVLGRPADVIDLFIGSETPATGPTPAVEERKAVSDSVLGGIFVLPAPAVDEERRRLANERLPLTTSTPGFPFVPRPPPSPFHDPRLPRRHGTVFNAATARDGAPPTEEQVAEARRGFQRLIFNMAQGAPRENLPRPDDELARQRLDIENQMERSEQPLKVLMTRTQQILDNERMNFQSIFDRVRTMPQSVLIWRSFATATDNIETVAVELGNAAVDDALAVGTAQTNDIVAVKAECLRLERDNRDMQDIAAGRKPHGYLSEEDTKLFKDEHKWEMEKKDEELEDLETSYNQLLRSIHDIQHAKRKREKETKINLARIRKERDENKKSMRAAETALDALKDGVQPSAPDSAELERTQQLLVAANQEIATLRAITTTDMPERALRAQLATLLEKIEKLEKENGTESQAAKEIANRLHARTQEKNELASKVAELEQEVDEATNLVEEHKQTVERLNRSVRDLEKSRRRSSDDYEAQKNLKSLQVTVDSLNVENKELKKENAELLDAGLRRFDGPGQEPPQASIAEDALPRQIARLKERLNKAESLVDALRATMQSQSKFVGRPTELLDYKNTIIGLQTENAQLRAGFLPEDQILADLEPLATEVVELRATLTRLRKEIAERGASQPTMPVATGQASRAKLIELEEQLIMSIESREAISLELMDLKRGVRKESDLNRRMKQRLEARIVSLSEGFADQASTIEGLNKVIEGQVFKSLDITGELNWDDRDRMWAALERPEVPLTIPDNGPRNLVLSENVIDLSIIRVQLLLYNLVNKRALYGMRENDAGQAADAAKEAVDEAKLLKNPEMLAKAYFWYAVVLYYYDDIHSARETFIEATLHGKLPELEAGIIEEWVARLDDTGPERSAMAYSGGMETLTFEDAVQFQAQTRAEHRAAIREATEACRMAVRAGLDHSRRSREKAKRKGARQATRYRNAEKLRKKRRSARPKRADDVQPRVSGQESDSDYDSDFPRPGGSGIRVRMSAKHGPATAQTKSGNVSVRRLSKLGAKPGQVGGSSTMAIEEPAQPEPAQSTWLRYIPFFRREQSQAPPKSADQPAKLREQYYYEPLSDEYILWEGKEFEDDPDNPWPEDEHRRNEFDTRPIPDAVMGINPEYNSGAELANPYSKFNEAANLARVLHGGLLPNERIPEAVELVGESGRGLYVRYEEGSEGWLYGQRILDDVRRRLNAIQQERDEHRTKEEVCQVLRDAAQQRETESDDERMTREVASRAQQAYIRDQEFYGEDVNLSDILAASETAVKKWRAFQLHAKGFYDDTLFGPAQVNEVSFRWLDEFIKNDLVQTRIAEGGSPMTEPEARMSKWVRYTQPVDENFKETLIEIGSYMLEEYAEGEMEEEDTEKEASEGKTSEGETEDGDNAEIEEEETEGDRDDETEAGDNTEIEEEDTTDMKAGGNSKTVQGFVEGHAKEEIPGEDSEGEISEEFYEEEYTEEELAQLQQL